MKKSLSTLLTLIAVVAFADLSIAGGKADGEKCHVSKSCSSKLCITLQPQDKFGVCCTPRSCASEGAQCGTLSDGCARPLECGTCDQGSACINNLCVGGTTTTTEIPPTTLPPTTLPPTTLPPTTLPPTTLPPTTLPPVPTTLPPAPTTTVPVTTRSCVGYCDTGTGRFVPPGDGPDCYCDSNVCSNADGCPDFFGTCVVNSPFLCD